VVQQDFIDFRGVGFPVEARQPVLKVANAQPTPVRPLDRDADAGLSATVAVARRRQR
jgi:hypothetical protein